jgi:hypothetical protein
MESCKAILLAGLRTICIWMAAIILGLVLFGVVDSQLEPNYPPAECPAGATCWDLRSMWN